jgi:predicted enzyme related to lactoylglutathione lyase
VTSGWEAQAPSPEFGGGGAGALDVYRTVFVWRTAIEGGTDEFRYSTLRDPDDRGHQLAGVMDVSAFLAGDVPDHWSIYWDVVDVHASVDTVKNLGGSLVDGPVDTPYGRMATETDPSGAVFKLRTPPS